MEVLVADLRHVRLNIARALSIIGHPALLLPAAVAVGATQKHASTQVLYFAAGGSLVAALCVVIFSLLQVRAGRWTHVDASAPHERRQLNRFLLLTLVGASTALWWLGQPKPVYTGLAFGAGLVAFAQLLAALVPGQLKVSMHVAFAVFAAFLLWPNQAGTAFVLVLAAGVAWSRLALGRHTQPEIIVGGLAGWVAGVGFALVAR